MVVNDGGQRWRTKVNDGGPSLTSAGPPSDHRSTTAVPPPDHRSKVVDRHLRCTATSADWVPFAYVAATSAADVA
ncbi:hypothetical protein Tco_1550221 [Tanacetum coccineum]